METERWKKDVDIRKKTDIEEYINADEIRKGSEESQRGMKFVFSCRCMYNMTSLTFSIP